MEKLFLIIWVGLIYSLGFIKEIGRRSHRRDAMLLTLKMVQGSGSQTISAASKSWERQGIRFPSIASGKNAVLWAPLRLLTSRSITINLCPFESKSEVTQSCPTLCDPKDYSLPGSSVHGIFQARVLEWVATAFSRGSSQPRDRTWVSCIVGRLFTIWALRKSNNTSN